MTNTNPPAPTTLNTPDMLAKSSGLNMDIVNNFYSKSRLFSDEIQSIERLMLRLLKNEDLYKHYKRSEFLKYDNLDTAFANYRKLPDMILVYFTDIDRYGLCTNEQYTHIASNIAECRTDGDNIAFNPRQIVLSSSRQKIVLLCLPQNKPKLETLVKEFFKSDIEFHINSDVETEIMILNKSEDNHVAVIKAFNEFHNFVYRRDAELLTGLRTPQIYYDSTDKQFIYKNIDVAKSYIVIDDIIKTLATVGPNITTLQININSTGIIGNKNNVSNAKDKYEIAKKWIADNPPAIKEITTSYYDRYKQDNISIVANNVFGKFVKNAGYKCIKCIKYRYWSTD